MPEYINVWQGGKSVGGNPATLAPQGIWTHGEMLTVHGLATSGAGKPHNNMPQSMAVPLWHRTS